MSETTSSKGFAFKIKGFFKNILSWCRKHKIIAAIILVAAVTMTVSAYKLKSFSPAIQADATYSFVRTTTLSKDGLETAVNVTGSVESADTSTVSYSAAAGSAPKIKTVNVAVGDYVEEGDVIVVLDNTDIMENITKQEKALTEKTAEAYEKYEDAVAAYEDASDAYDESITAVNSASSKKNAAKKEFDSAKNNVSAYQAEYNNAVAEHEKLGVAANECYNQLASAKTEYSTADSADKKAGDDVNAKQSAYDDAVKTRDDASADAETDAETLAKLEKAVTNASTALQTANTDKANTAAALDESAKKVANAQSSYDTAQKQYNDYTETVNNAKNALENAKKACNYSTYESAYNNAVAAYNSAVANQQSFNAKEESAKAAMEQAYEAYEDSQTSDVLEDLYEQLENCNLTAETNGKVTSLNATVGATANGTIATIQNTDSLKISVTIQEADINSVAVGMSCNIRSDATDGTISGTLTQIDPVSSMGGSFGAEVTVNGGAQGLLIGMNADVDIVISTVDDCFTVPADAIGEDEIGSFIYRYTSGEGVDMEFEKVYVTLGESNDYYVEISSDKLNVGDIIRSYSDLTVGIEEVTGEDAAEMQFGNMFGGMGGFGGSTGAAPSGDNFGGSNGQRPEMPGGDRSNNGGGMPSGMPSGGGMP